MNFAFFHETEILNPIIAFETSIYNETLNFEMLWIRGNGQVPSHNIKELSPFTLVASSAPSLVQNVMKQ
jgi:hypothetical protein